VPHLFPSAPAEGRIETGLSFIAEDRNASLKGDHRAIENKKIKSVAEQHLDRVHYSDKAGGFPAKDALYLSKYVFIPYVNCFDSVDSRLARK